MDITEKDVAYVADLASLELTADERSRMVKDLGAIINYISRLNELDTSGVAPLAQVAMLNPLPAAGAEGDEASTMREDKAQPSLDRDTVLQNAPQQANGFFKVPRVISTGE